MPIVIEYTEANRGVILNYIDEVFINEVIGAMKNIYESEIFPTLIYSISDRTNCTKLHAETPDLNDLIELTKSFMMRKPNFIVATVNPNDSEFGMSRMYEMKSGILGFNMMVFRERQEADKWVLNELHKT